MDRFNLNSMLNCIYEKYYGCETWSVTIDNMKKLMIFEKSTPPYLGSIVENGEY